MASLFQNRLNDCEFKAFFTEPIFSFFRVMSLWFVPCFINFFELILLIFLCKIITIETFYYLGVFVRFDFPIFKKGLKDGVAIGVSYIPMAAGVSIAAQKLAFPFGIWELMNGLVYSGSAQTAILNLISNGETALLVYILTFSIINCRHILYSLSLATKLDPNMSALERLLFAPFNTDETYAVAMNQPEKFVSASYLFGIIIIPWVCQIIGSSIGYLFTSFFPPSWNSAFGITIYAILISLIVPPMRKSKEIILAVLCAAALSFGFELIPFIKQFLSPGIVMILCTVLTCTIGAVVFPVKDDSDKSGSEKT